MTTIVVATVVVTLLIMLLSLLVQQVRSVLLPVRLVGLTINQHQHQDVQTGEKLLQVLAAANIHLPSSCAGAGTCGLCKVVVHQGGGPLLATERAILSDPECENGVRLASQVAVREDLSITIANEVLEAEHWQCTVESCRYLSPLIKEFVLKLPDQCSFSFEAGTYVEVTAPAYQFNYADFQVDNTYLDDWQRMDIQHLVAQTPGPVTRAYSMANTATANQNVQTHITLLVRLALPPPNINCAPGVVSSYLFSLTAGDKLEVKGPFGDFTLQDNNRQKVFIGGGVGMAPLRAMIHAQLQKTDAPELHFYYGARSLKDLFYKEEFDQLQDNYRNFNWTVALSEPATQDQWVGETGFIHEIVERQFITDNPQALNCDYYLCGPPLMLDAVIAMLTDAGIDQHHIYADSFGG